LSVLGLDQDALSLDDASGLSAENRITPDYVVSLLAQIYRNEEVLSFMKEGFPVAGVDGSLDDRFDGSNEALHGQVFAKTGSIQGVRSLAGWVTAEDGSDLVFAFFASGDVSDAARGALETVVAGVYGCGSNLADF
jgi:D-alanyl-D-alanine carboxypeptidase/D-alanyl-D-alanine-endopeptidase (penicillin-binding protein 4)